MENKVTSPLTKGLIISLVLIVMDLIGGFTHVKYEAWYRWLPTIVLCIGIIWACIHYANQMNNLVTFGNVFGHGFKASLLLAFIMLVYSLLSIYVIFPETRDIVLDESRKQMEKQEQMSEDQIDQAVEMTRKFFLVGVIMFAFLGTLFAGTIASLLGGAFAKKKPISPNQQTF